MPLTTMSKTNSLVQGRRGARYTKFETYTNNKGAWNKTWSSFCQCEVKTLPPHGCKVLNEQSCPIHARLVPTKVDFSQDGRPRLRASVSVPGEFVQITGRAAGKMRMKQQNQRMTLNLYNFFVAHTNHQPYPGDIKPGTHDKYEYSHLCLRPDCFEGHHITYETRPQNRDRERCVAETCHLRSSMGMQPHVPPCIMSAQDVMRTFNEVRLYRQRRFPNWQKRGKKKKTSMDAGVEKENKGSESEASDEPTSPKKKIKKRRAEDNDSDVEIVASFIKKRQSVKSESSADATDSSSSSTSSAFISAH